MSRFGAQYQVPRSTGTCAATGEPLTPGSPCVAALCDRAEDEGFERLDFTIDAWEAGHRPDRLFSHWQTTMVAPEERQQLLVDDDVLVDMFERLAEDERPQRIAFRFVLALILMRKRLLRFTGRSGSGENERWRMRRRGAAAEEPDIEVVNPQLSEEDVRELTAQIGEIVQGSL